jgi:hypothetical protein
VDIYKIYTHLQNERKLEADEKKELKYYQRRSDILTPMLKLISSEYCNQIAYDALQIHGGTGYMKDFPIERIYRDARITNIYEGTSQLQVVAAIRGVYNGLYLNIMKEFEEEKIKPELEYIKRELVEMTEQYEKSVQQVLDVKNNEYIDFHARRMVEMAGNIIISYLLLMDAMRDDKYKNSAMIFTRKAKSENLEKADFIARTELKDLGSYKLTN